MIKVKKEISVGSVKVGGGAPVSVQSMCNTKTEDIQSTIRQISALSTAGCDIVRLAVPNMAAALAISSIKEKVSIPIVADIHFDYRLAVEAAERGVDKIRINPGNIGGFENVKAVAAVCRKRGIPIRVGVNSGSVEKDLLKQHGHVTAEAMVESARRHVKLLNDCDFDDICLSLKASTVSLCIEAYRLAHEAFDYPLHLGVTEAGTPKKGIVRSAVGLGAMLSEGIGDTIRVSLTGDPVEEVTTGIEILKALDLRKGGVRVVSCPTCGRTEVDLIKLAESVEERLSGMERDITVAVMGCVVNGPGEAREADYGVAGGVGCGLLFKKGEAVRRVEEHEIVDALLKLIESES